MRLLPLLLMIPGCVAQVKVGGFPSPQRTFYSPADGLPSADVREVRVDGGRVRVQTAAGAAAWTGTRWEATPFPAPVTPPVAAPAGTRAVAPGPSGEFAAASADGLFVLAKGSSWTPVLPRDGARSWAPHDVRGVAYDEKGRLWFASPQGVGVRETGGEWRLYGPEDGLPLNTFTGLAAGAGSVWLATTRGVIRFDGKTWEYRQGQRWLPSDDVRSVAVEANGTAWFGTAAGVGRITFPVTTLAAKARFFEDEIDARHRRTEYGYVLDVTVDSPGSKARFSQHDSDNDGLWTAMYGAGECFAYAVDKSPVSRRRARQAFLALEFLGKVTQGGKVSPPPGYVARTVLPASQGNPNESAYTPERDRQTRATRDRLWKVMSPRWPLSADGKWYWKADTSSDELDGHYFFYGAYFDLVAKGDRVEEARVRRHVAALTDHLVKNNFQLMDHDGEVTRWAFFNPERLNRDPVFAEERSLNSISILSYLRTAQHITGDARYGAAARELMDKHAYDINTLTAKTNAGPGSGNQSDDEMAFMCLYNLMRYETDARLRSIFGLALRRRWEVEKPELNPLFNFIAAAGLKGVRFADAFRDADLSADGGWLEESVDTLKRYPQDRFNWGLENSHRLDIVMLPEFVRGRALRGFRRDGRVLPIDERFVGHWNHDPWALDYGGNGRSLADGASYLLPYYMGRYHGFLLD